MNDIINKLFKIIVIAFVAVTVSALIRITFLGVLESKLAWLTFYPVVIVAALFGGFFSGLLAAILSALIINFGWEIFSNTPFINNDADLLGLAVFIFNSILISGVAEYSRQQRNKAKAQADIAELANKSKSIFLANMSHELRTPLNSILGFSRLIKNNSLLSIEENKRVDIIINSGKHLLALINNVLDIAKVEAGKMEKDISIFNLKDTLKDIYNVIDLQAATKNLEFSYESSIELPSNIKTDEGKLRQIILNLLGNAVKFTHKGKVTFNATCQLADNGKNGLLQIEIIDTGIGIESKDHNSIFKPFVQVETVEKREGTGLGLAICKQFVVMLNGSIQVKSELGKGTSMYVDIPIEIITDKIHQVIQSSDNSIHTLAPDQQEFKVLIVEDQDENWMLLQKILEDAGFKVKVATNGKLGIYAFKEWNPHLIWMDIRMPVLDGIEASKQIRSMEQGKGVKIVAVSAHVFKSGIEDVLKSGFDDFVKKPYEFSDIYNMMEKHLGVKYIKDNSIRSNKAQSTAINLESLNAMPELLITNLEDSLISLDSQSINIAIAEIKQQNSELGNSLTTYSANYRYSELLKAINSIKSKA